MTDIPRTLIICVSLHPISNQQKIDMQKNLVIVESPAKAKTIEKFLGKDYKVMSSYGHIRDLKTKDFSIDLEHNYAPEYVIPSDKKKLVTELKNEAKKAEQVWLASDEDREGEAISWHLYEVLGLKPENTKRIVFHEITKNAILHAIETPRDINIDLVNAQQARRILDRIVGFELSPILWRKVKPALSAGRVQSVAVRLIVEREREINEFVSEAAYRVIASFILPDGTTILKAELNRRLKDKEEVEAFLESCKDASFTIDDISKKPVRKTPAPPFTTSTLQQEAARKLGYSVSQTMMIAQRLYESGLITYMRTDSVNLSDLALGTAKEAILDTYGEKYYKFRQYHTKSKGAQEAHEAIRPTYISHDEISGTAQEKRLYELIRKRTIGEYEGKVMVAAVGRFGPFIRHDGKFVSIPKGLNPLSITAEEAIELIEAKKQKDEQRFIKKFDEDPEMEILNGRFGPYISYKKKNYRIPKTIEKPENLTLEECQKIIAEAGEKPAATKKRTTRKKA